MFEGKKICVLAPHTDDGELGAGGLINKFIDSAKEIKYFAFSICSDSLPDNLPKDTLKKECQNATNKLGISAENLYFFDYKVREFQKNRQSILDQMITIRKTHNPDIILTPSSNDVHQDHKTIYKESVRAFKNNILLGYEMPWNCLAHRAELLVAMDINNLTTKIESLKKYQSQTGRRYVSKESIQSMAIYNGLKADTSYAEAFEVIRWVIK